MMITEMSSTIAVLLVVGLSKKLRFQREFFISSQSTRALKVVTTLHIQEIKLDPFTH